MHLCLVRKQLYSESPFRLTSPFGDSEKILFFGEIFKYNVNQRGAMEFQANEDDENQEEKTVLFNVDEFTVIV